MNNITSKPQNIYQDYITISSDKVIQKLNSSPEGLTEHETKKRLIQYGHNSIKTHKKTSLIIEFLKNFTNPLIIVLLVISIVSFILGETLDGSIVFGMVIMSVTLNFIQEHKAGKAAQKLLERVALISTVIRDGKEKNINSNLIVPGDILILNAGDLIPADARLIEAKDFFVNQSSLTGESFPLEKNPSPIEDKDVDISKLQNVIFAGTNVITGEAKAVVITTGENTEYGAIAKDLSAEEEDNNFTLGIKSFSLFILRVVMIFVIIIFAANALIKHDFIQSLTFAIAVAVGLTPEFLPMIMTVTMAKGAVIMSGKGVIVKRLTAIPTFGSMDILCTDKTGTITQDKIKLVKYINFDGQTDDKILELAYVNSSFQTGINNPLDEAIKAFKHLKIGGYKKIDEIPFDFERKRMSVVAGHNDGQIIITKGAPENIFEVSDHYLSSGKHHKLNEESLRKLTNLYHDLSKDGYRVLALATKTIGKSQKTYSKTDEHGLVFVGFTAFLDPVKENVKDAIDKLEAIGIEIKVITGDNELVTQKACLDAGIAVKGIVLGHEIDKLHDSGLGILAMKNTIFARFSPAQKNRVITALRSKKHVVGYMGDGINDAPSLKSADVGISVSNAVDVAKETADMILTNKSLFELADGVVEGRKIFGNTMKYIMMGLSSNFGNMFSVLGAVLFLPFLPMLPIQILLNNFLYDLSQLTIPSDNVDEEYLHTPKHWDMKFISRFMLIFGPISSVFDFLTFAVLYSAFGNNPSAFQTGWFMESLATQVLVIYIIRTQKLPFIGSSPSKALLISTLTAVSLGWLIPFTKLGPLFGLTPLTLVVTLTLASIVFTYLLAVEIGKRIFYHSLNSPNNYVV